MNDWTCPKCWEAGSLGEPFPMEHRSVLCALHQLKERQESPTTPRTPQQPTVEWVAKALPCECSFEVWQEHAGDCNWCGGGPGPAVLDLCRELVDECAAAGDDYRSDWLGTAGARIRRLAE